MGITSVRSATLLPSRAGCGKLPLHVWGANGNRAHLRRCYSDWGRRAAGRINAFTAQGTGACASTAQNEEILRRSLRPQKSNPTLTWRVTPRATGIVHCPELTWRRLTFPASAHADQLTPPPRTAREGVCAMRDDQERT